MKPFFVCLTALLLITAACSPTVSAELTDDQLKHYVIGKLDGRKPVLTISNGELQAIAEHTISTIDSPKDYELVSYNDGKFYLQGNAMRDGDKVRFAIEVVVGDDGISYERMNMPWYLCIQKDCKSCGFLPTATGSITGCDCSNTGKGAGCNFTSGIKSSF